ncbi:hypothetical protein H7U32_00800 [Bifidobacterium pullorum subsp. saeculare]|uniref:Uncharacterized protein n=2 Tax=Bifidobacterium pullorum TaxID=78448 RepID=A0A938WXM0_9BIFI|nr:hypothetical protein [Bifidobacterium pullorum subsp. saeculare]
MRAQMREHRSTFVVYVTLRLLVIVTMVLQFLNGNYENVALCVATLLMLIAPSFVQVRFQVELPDVLEIILLVFVFASEILGEISAFYVIFPFWDTILHTLNGFIAAAIGFSLIDILNRSAWVESHLSPLYVAMMSFCFSMTIGVLWEFFEFTMDMLFGFDMQKDTVVHSISSVLLGPTGGNTPTAIRGITEVAVNGRDLGLGGYLDIGLIDTMQDLIVNFIGAFVFCVFGYLYVRNRGRRTWLSRLIPHRRRAETETEARTEALESAR